ncbi:MAG TPA: DUF1552 domain-containing protein [Polyangia bacterium]|jgi:hypothetical protein
MSIGWLKSNKRELSRRVFLGGAGTVVALPILDSLLSRQVRAAAAETPKRLIYYYVPNGITMPDWTPVDTGPNYTVSKILKPLEHLRSDFMVVSGLANSPGFPDGGNGDHGAGTASFGTAAHAFKSETILKLGASADQIAASAMMAAGVKTRVQSMQLGMDAGKLVGGCDNGYGCAYSNSVSWAGVSQPLTKVTNPQSAFNVLFNGFDPTASLADQTKRRAYKTSVLDRAIAQVTGLEAKLGATDRKKLDQYLTSVREVEREVTDTSGDMSCTPGNGPGSPSGFEPTLHAFSDIMVLAMQCDVTRVFSFMLGDAASVRVYSNLPGIVRGHHDISHHGGIQANIDQLTQIDTYEIQQVDYLLTKMKAIPEGDKDMLYNATLFFSGDISDGNSHSHNDMPVLVAGHGGGMLNTGQSIKYQLQSVLTDGVKFGNMLATTIRTVGVNMPVGNSDGVLTEALNM